jgi:predicted aminopeptidase
MNRRWLVAGTSLLVTVGLVVVTVFVTTGCSALGYYAQSARGHLGLMAAAKPVPQWLDEPDLAADLRQRLVLSQRLRDFAIQVLKLPDNRSYRSYADLKRSAAVWNVVAAPVLSLKLKTWCFPVVGCVGYRGYYSESAARHEADGLRAQGLEASVYPVPAYSTLGWMNWLGGDPLLNTFIRWPEGELARLIFHELAHQEAYAAGDTRFNESFATSVERIGAGLWLAQYGSPAARDAYRQINERRHDFNELTRQARDQLNALYDSTLDDADKRQRKAVLYARLQADYQQMKAERWGGYSGYDRFFAEVNNASLGVLAAYDDEVPAFEQLFQDQGRDFSRFYAEVRRLAALPRPQRDDAVAALGREAAAAGLGREAAPHAPPVGGQ